MALTLKTPGVYIQELNAFPSSVVQVATAIPAFVGYTQRAERSGKSLVNKPTRITSLAEFHSLFGMEFTTRFSVAEDKNDPPGDESFKLNGKSYVLEMEANNRTFFYQSIRMFYANGGGACYVVSCGTYGNGDSITIEKGNLEEGIKTLLKEDEPTMIVLPDATLLEDRGDCYALYQNVLGQCAKLQDRFGIFDVYDGDRELDDKGDDVIKAFREGVGNNHLKYGAAYYPWIQTGIVAANELDYDNFKDLNQLNDLIVESKEPNAQDLIAKLVDLNKEGKLEEEKSEIADRRKAKKEAALTPEKLEEEAKEGIKVKKLMFGQALLASSPTYKNLLVEMRRQMNLMPPSTAMAGVYSMVDFTRGVWKAPANVSLNSVLAPAINIDNDEQQNLNVDGNFGKSINVIRSFPGAGVIVWGARTLDGNSQDWRYINVRRTMIMIEQSIKNASKSYVFEPNVQSTWSDMRIMIESYLNGLWKQGALAGPSPSAAYLVQVGLGSTMTPNDILEGIMRITVKVAISRPAEFIVLTFQQKMQEGGGGE